MAGCVPEAAAPGLADRLGVESGGKRDHGELPVIGLTDWEEPAGGQTGDRNPMLEMLGEQLNRGLK